MNEYQKFKFSYIKICEFPFFGHTSKSVKFLFTAWYDKTQSSANTECILHYLGTSRVVLSLNCKFEVYTTLNYCKILIKTGITVSVATIIYHSRLIGQWKIFPSLLPNLWWSKVHCSIQLNFDEIVSWSLYGCR